MNIEAFVNILAEEVVLGPTAGTTAISAKMNNPLLAAERERLRARLGAIAAELSDPAAGTAAIDIVKESIRRLRAEVLPGWTSPFLALDTEDLASAEGRRLFVEVREALERHYKFEQPWHAVLCALFVMQAHIARILPATFYLIIKGRYGGGKTSLLNVIGRLGCGLVFENVSVAALARELTDGRLVCIDEYDVRRPQEIQAVLDSLVRQGYRRDAAPYTRYDAAGRKNEHLPTYGPKALTIRSFLDPALESRGFIISASPVDGEEAYGFVVRNLWSDVGDLPTRLARWASESMDCWPDSRLKEIAESDEFADKRHRVLEVTGANRDTEQVLIALLVAEVAGVDVAAELKEAVQLRRASIGMEDAGDLEDATEAILNVSAIAQDRLMAGSPRIRVWFRALKKDVNARREDRKDPPIGDRRLSTMLTQLGVSESWRRTPNNRVCYDVPVEWLRQLRGSTPNSLNMPNAAVKDESDRGVTDVSQPAPDTVADSPRDPGDLHCGRETRAETARRRLESPEHGP